MHELIAIALGGSCGAVTRFLAANGIYALLGRSFPIATLFINVSGSFLMGFLTELMLQRFALSVEYRAAILIGFLGAYTTFSTFALETLYLFEDGSLLKAFLNMFLSAVLCILACWIGQIWGRTLLTDTVYPWLEQSRPYLYLLVGTLWVLLLTTIAEFLSQQFSFSPQIKVSVFIVILGAATITSTLWFAFKLAENRLEFQGLLSIFIINALFGVLMVRLGSWLGDWLWRLNLSQSL